MSKNLLLYLPGEFADWKKENYLSKKLQLSSQIRITIS